MAPPLRFTAEVPTPLAVADSERTLILQRRIGRIGIDNNKRRSAYFADSDASATSGGGEPSATLPQRAVAARTGSTGAVPASGSTRAEGRWILGGIRHSHGQLRETQPHQYRDANAFGNGLGKSARTGDPTTSTEDDQKRDRRGAAAVFYGSIRFPASRVALWNRRPTGSPVTLTPESAAPILVLRQSAADAVATKLSSMAEGAHAGLPNSPLRWHGVLGSAADALHGRAASDPRAASTLSSAALEIVGLGDETSRSLCGVGAFAASDRAHGRRQGWPQRARAIALGGVLSATEKEKEDGRGGGGERRGLVLDEAYYRALLDDCTKAIGSAKSASPEIFTPLRLQCSLKGHRAAARDGSRRRGRDGSEASSRRPRRAQQASAQATLSLRGEMVVPGLGVRLTPIASLALLHTALYQSLLTRGADEKLQSGLLTLNEGRRAVLLSDDDPLSFRAHVVGVWVSGRTGDGGSGGSGSGGPSTSGGQHHHHGRRPSLLSHPYTYPACLRFLLGAHRGSSGIVNGNGNGGGSNGGGGGASRPAATPASFLVLHLPGGVDGGAPAFFEACALSNGKAASATAGRGLDVKSAGFEHLDFSADIDVTVGGEGTDEGGEEERGGRRGGGGAARAGGGGGGGGGGDSRANRAVVIGRLRRVLKPSLAEPFGRALDEAMGSSSSPSRQRNTPQMGRHSYLRSSAPATPAAPAVTAANVSALPSSQPQRHAGDQGARWHSRHHATAAGADNAGPPPLDESLDEPLDAPAPMAPPIKPTAVNAPSASLHSGQNRGVSASVGRVSVPTAATAPTAAAAVAVVTPSPIQHRQGAGVNQHPLQTRGVGPIGESSVVGGGRGGGSPLFLEDEPFERQGKKSSAIPRASGTGEGTGAEARSPLSSPPPPPSPPFPPLDGGGQPDSTSVPRQGSFDLLALEPAARVYFLAQQRQLSTLEHQLRQLQATMHAKQQQQPQSEQQHRPQQLRSLPQQQSPLQPVRFSVDHPFGLVSSSGPALGIHAAAAAAAATVAAAAAEAAEQVSTDRQALPLSESCREAGAGETATCRPIQASARDTRVPMVEVGTSTSFLWGPAVAAAVPPPPPLSHGANKERPIGSDASPPASTAATATVAATATAAAATLSRPADARSSTGSMAPRGLAASASPPAGQAVRSKPAQGREVGGWTLPPTERVQSSPASRSGESAAATSSGWTTQRGHAAEGDSQRQRRRRRDGSGEGESYRGDESGGNVTDDSTCSGSEGDEEALERAPPLVLWLPGESSGVTLPNDRDRERWCRVPQRMVASSLARGGDKDKHEVAAKRERQERRQGRRLSTGPPATPEARETAVKVDPSTSDDDGDRQWDRTPEEEEGGGEKTPGVTVISPNRNMYDQGASRLSPTTASRRDGGGDGGSSGGGDGTAERRKAIGDGFEGGGEVLHRRWRPLVAGYRGSGNVVPVTITELAVVPRIEFDHLTDDELGFDLDEGETICRIESKYLKRGSTVRTRSKRQ